MNQAGFFLNSVSQSLDVGVYDDLGIMVTGLSAATFPPLIWSLAGPNATVAWPVLIDLALETSPYLRGGMKERAEGSYRLDLPDEIFGKGGTATIRGEASNKHMLCPIINILDTAIITPSSDPRFVNCYGVTRNPDGSRKPGVVLLFELRDPHPLSTSDFWDETPDLSRTSDINGNVTILLPLLTKWRVIGPDKSFADFNTGQEATKALPVWAGHF